MTLFQLPRTCRRTVLNIFALNFCRPDAWHRPIFLGGFRKECAAFLEFLSIFSRKEDVMKTNIGYVDRAIRAVLGLIIMWVAFEQRSSWGIVGFFPGLTAYFGICPIYHWLHISTFHPTHQ